MSPQETTAQFMTFGAYLRHLRKRAELSQTELGLKVGYTGAHISNLERNKRPPDIATLVALFVPALDLHHQPQDVAQLIELAAAARGEQLTDIEIHFNDVSREETKTDITTTFRPGHPISTENSKSSKREPFQGSVGMLIGAIAGMPGNLHLGVEQFLHEYLGSDKASVPFGGREDQLAQLDDWLKSPSQTHALLIAPAGRGKSALLANWIAQIVVQEQAVVAFLPVSIRFGTARLSTSLSILGARLRELHAIQAEWPHSSDTWVMEIDQYLSTDNTSQRPLLVVLDGIDEAIDWECGQDLRFPTQLGRGVKVLASARVVAGRDAAGWLRRLEWPNSTMTMELPPLNRHGIATTLAGLDDPPGSLAAEVDIVGELYRITEGDPLLLRLYIEALRTETAGSTLLRPESLAGISPGLEAYFERWWDDQRRQWGTSSPLLEPVVSTLFTVLACALGPLRNEDVLALTIPEQINTWSLGEALQPVQRFVIGNGRQQGYVFSHPRLQYYFYEQLTGAEQKAWERRYVEYGEQSVAALNLGQLSSQDISPYVVQYYGTHLQRTDADLAQWNSMIGAAWLQAWEMLEGTYDGFLRDLERAWRRADRDGAALQGERQGTAIGLQCRYLLIQSSINSLTSEMPPSLIIALVKQRVWSPLQGLSAAERLHDRQQRLEAVTQLAADLPESLLLRAFGAVLTIVERVRDFDAQLAWTLDSVKRGFVYGFSGGEESPETWTPVDRLLALFSRPLLDEVIARVSSIQNEYARQQLLIAIIACLVKFKEPVLARSLADNLVQTWQQASALQRADYPAQVAKYMDRIRARMLIKLARSLPEFVDEALSVCITSNDEYGFVKLASVISESLLHRFRVAIEKREFRAEALEALYARMPTEHQPTVLAEAVEAARAAISQKYPRAEGAIAVIPHLPLVESHTILAEAHEVAASEYRRGNEWMLRRLIPHLPEHLLASIPSIIESAKADVFDISSFEIYATRLAAIGDTQSALAIVQAIKLNRLSIHNSLWRLNRSVAQVSRHFDMQARWSAFTHAKRATDYWNMETIYKVVAQIQDPQEVLSWTKNVSDTFERVGVMVALIDQQTMTEQAIVLSLIRQINDRRARIWALDKVAPHLAATLLKDALSIVREINDLSQQICTLVELGGVQEALKLIIELPAHEQTAMLINIFPQLSAPERNRIVDDISAAVRAIEPTSEHASFLQDQFMLLSKEYDTKIILAALVSARAVSDSVDRASLLSELIPYLPPATQELVLAEALAAIKEIHSPTSRIRILMQLVPFLQPNIRSRVVTETLTDLESIAELQLYVSALTQWVPYVSASARPQILAKTLENAQRLDAAEKHTQLLASGSAMLADLAIQLAREGYKDEALSIAHQIEYPYWRMEALLGVQAYLPKEERSALVAEALEAARSIGKRISVGDFSWDITRWVETTRLDPTTPAKAFARIASHLPGEACFSVLNEAVSMAQTGMFDRAGDFSLACLAPHMASLGFPEHAYPLAQSVADPIWRAGALAALVPYLPEEQRAAVFEQALAVIATLEARYLDSALYNVIPNLISIPPSERYTLWCQLAHQMAREDRDRVLRQIPALVPIIAGLGGQEAIVQMRQSIAEIGQWLP